MENRGQLIRRYRKKSNLTQQELSIKLGISSNHLSLIENNKKGISKKLADKLMKIFNFTEEEGSTLYSGLEKRYYTKEDKEKLLLREKELEEKELELINTYDFIRENHLTLSKRAAINNILINYFSKTEELVTNLELKILDENEVFLKKISPAVKTTIKKISKKMEELENMVNTSSTINITNKGVKEMNSENTIDNLIQLIPKDQLMKALTKEQKRMAILTYVAQNLKIKWKEYNVPGCASGISIRLWEGGRGTAGKKGYMRHVVSNYIDLQLDGADNSEEFQELLNDIVNNIIEHSMVIVEDALSLARKAKTAAVRRKYLNSMNDKKFLLASLQIGIILYATELKERGYDINHEYLSLRLDGMKENKSELRKAWAEFRNSEQTEEDYQKLLDVTSEILKEFEEKRELNEKQLNKIVKEKLILTFIGEDNIEKYMYGIMDKMCQNITGKIRLIDMENL